MYCIVMQCYFTECSVEGQVRKRCGIPENCTRTCDNKNEFIECPMDCSITGCYCPQGKVVNKLFNSCMPPNECPASKL